MSQDNQISIALRPPRQLAVQALMLVVVISTFLSWEIQLLNTLWWDSEPAQLLPEQVRGVGSPAGIVVLFGSLILIVAVQGGLERWRLVGLSGVISAVAGFKLADSTVGHRVSLRNDYQFEKLSDFVLYRDLDLLDVLDFSLVRPGIGVYVAFAAALAGTAVLILDELMGGSPHGTPAGSEAQQDGDSPTRATGLSGDSSGAPA